MKIYLDTIGCRLNQSEIESYARQMRAAGHTLVGDPSQAELAIVNTCTVTAAASADSRKKIRHIARTGAKEIVVTGCWSTLEPLQASALPKVTRVIPNAQKDNLVSEILGIPQEKFDLNLIAREPIPGARLRTRAFIKVQDGCDNKCTFCITTIARGESQSQSVQDILNDINAALQGGSQEIVLTGVHLGSWGRDFQHPKKLSDLVKLILQETDVPRLRLSSLEPWDLDEPFFDLWSNPRLARHLHLPLQSGCKDTLRRMARKITPESFARVVATARDAIPDVAITTDVIAGFPGENELEFEKSLAFIEAMEFAGGHVFTYSARPHTAAASMPNQVPYKIRKTRNEKIRDYLAQSSTRYRARFLGHRLSVLWERATILGEHQWTLNGLSDNYLRITAQAPKQLWNRITPVLLTDFGENGLIGKICKSSSPELSNPINIS